MQKQFIRKYLRHAENSKHEKIYDMKKTNE